MAEALRQERQARRLAGPGSRFACPGRRKEGLGRGTGETPLRRPPPHAGCHPGFGKAEDREPVAPNGSVQAVELPPDRRWRLASRHHPTRRILDACLRRRDTRERGERLPPHACRGCQWIPGRRRSRRAGAYSFPERWRGRAAPPRVIPHAAQRRCGIGEPSVLAQTLRQERRARRLAGPGSRLRLAREDAKERLGRAAGTVAGRSARPRSDVAARRRHQS
ncbi:hypothetical protein SAMN05421512_109159 [Stappia indica]|uniref:Uncharacterized protein n=1 Tax=Stappia indica TaxID=538381 RepID=A0A285T8Z0_9HYPH|nr:hypothetical protein SAMN05421512_109159 [Stappia indica]